MQNTEYKSPLKTYLAILETLPLRQYAIRGTQP
jgi:hypothetical protein